MKNVRKVVRSFRSQVSNSTTNRQGGKKGPFSGEFLKFPLHSHLFACCVFISTQQNSEIVGIIKIKTHFHFFSPISRFPLNPAFLWTQPPMVLRGSHTKFTAFATPLSSVIVSLVVERVQMHETIKSRVAKVSGVIVVVAHKNRQIELIN